MERIRVEIEKVKQSAYDAGEAGLSFGDKLKRAIGNLSRYLLSFASFYRIVGTLKQGISIVSQMDKEFTELLKVSNDSLSVLKEYKLQTYELADAVGTTANQIMQSTADWVRLGKSMEEASELAQLSTKLLNVSEFDNINEATNALVSATQAYKDVDANLLIDKLNLVGVLPKDNYIGKRLIQDNTEVR